MCIIGALLVSVAFFWLYAMIYDEERDEHSNFAWQFLAGLFLFYVPRYAISQWPETKGLVITGLIGIGLILVGVIVFLM